MRITEADVMLGIPQYRSCLIFFNTKRERERERIKHANVKEVNWFRAGTP